MRILRREFRRRLVAAGAVLAALGAALAVAGGAAAAPLLDTTLTTSVTSPTTSHSAGFSWASNDVAVTTFQCSLDGAPWAACSSPRTYNGLTDGSHTFAVKAWTPTVEDLTPASFSWTIEAAPDTIIWQAPPADSTATTATIQWAADSPGATFECQLDAAPWEACSSPRTYNGLVAGTHLFKVRAIKDTLVDATPATATWIVEGPPDTVIGTAPSGITTLRSATIDWTSTKLPATYECQFDSNTWFACSSPKAFNGLTTGLHWFKVRATWSGLTDATPAVASWTIEGTPQTTLTTVPSPNGPPRTASLAWVADLQFATFE